MSNALHRTVLFHGALKRDIDALQCLEIIQGFPVGWLGPGIYFWDCSGYTAQCWAENAVERHGEHEEPCIGRLEIELKSEEWIDFNDPWMRSEFIDFTTRYDEMIAEEELRKAWSEVADTRAVSLWGFWLNLWILYWEHHYGRKVRGLRAVIRHQGFTFNEDVPRLEKHSVPDMKGFHRRKKSRKDSANVQKVDDETHPRFPDAGIAWIIRCPDLIRRITCWAP